MEPVLAKEQVFFMLSSQKKLYRFEEKAVQVRGKSCTGSNKKLYRLEEKAVQLRKRTPTSCKKLHFWFFSFFRSFFTAQQVLFCTKKA